MSSGNAAPGPVVSVIIPAYNVAPFIGEALRSVFSQDFRDFEVIVVNDGSDDGLDLALRPFRDRLTYLSQENRGCAAARNVGVQAAAGGWLAFLDADDSWEPGFLSRQMAAAEARRLDLIWSDGTITGDSLHAGRRMMETAPSKGPVTVSALIKAKVNVFTSSVVVRRDVVVAAGGFDERLRRAQDFDLWVRLAHAGARMGWSPEVLYRYRVRSGSLTGGALSQVERELGVLKALDAKVDFGPDDRAVLHSRLAMLEGERHLVLAKQAIRDRDYWKARVHLRESRIRSPKVLFATVLIRLAPDALRRFFGWVVPEAER